MLVSITSSNSESLTFLSTKRCLPSIPLIPLKCEKSAGITGSRRLFCGLSKGRLIISHYDRKVRSFSKKNEGFAGQDDADMGMDSLESSRTERLKESIRRVTEEDLDVAIDKYNIGDELYENIDFAQINAFSDQPFGGNPAAVCYLPFQKSSEWMQSVAKQFNLSETAFIVKRRVSTKSSSDVQAIKNEFDLRWFTPKVEVDLCGHATLAAAHLLFTSGIADNEMVLFHTRSGVLKAKRINDDSENSSLGRLKSKPHGEVGAIGLDFPAVLVSQCDSNEVKELSSVLEDSHIVWAGKTSMGDYLVELPNMDDVKYAKPIFQKMMDFGGRGGLIVTSAADSTVDFDYISRFFCPKAGIPEDPVTGSAHCTLGPYWADKLQKKTLKAYQASERGGRLTVIVEKGARVFLQGNAIVVMVGVLLNNCLNVP